KQEISGEKNHRDLDVTDHDIGDDFADEHLARSRRHGEKIFHRAAFAFAGDGQPGDHDHRHGENHTHQTGNDIVLGDDFGVVERVNAQVDRVVAGGKRIE